MGKFEGDKLKSGTFSPNIGYQIEPFFLKPLHANDFQNYACSSGRGMNKMKRGVCGPIQN